jgi:hypothetical protein
MHDIPSSHCSDNRYTMPVVLQLFRSLSIKSKKQTNKTVNNGNQSSEDVMQKSSRNIILEVLAAENVKVAGCLLGYCAVWAGRSLPTFERQQALLKCWYSSHLQRDAQALGQIYL